MSVHYRFGTLEIRPDERLVLIDGIASSLRGRAFDLLIALMDRRGRVVPRAELYEAVWGSRVVEEGNLDVQVHAIRKLLGRQALVTVPGRGYRFALAPSDPADVLVMNEQSGSTGLIPPLPTRLVGREDDLVTLDALLAEERLITVLGAGGIGKTTVAVAAAHRRKPTCRHGVVWVDASPVRDAVLLLQVVARAFDLVSAGSMVCVRAFANAIESTRALLVIDNAEHLVEAVAHLANEILHRAQGVQILVTSQAALKLTGEHLFRLEPLSIPDSKASLAEAECFGAVRLFAEVAKAADRRFRLDENTIASVISLCRHLDGLPLAIELAASRVPFLGVRGLETRLSNRLPLPGGGLRNAPTRQQTLRAALDWSYSLLAPEEKTVLHRLAVFIGTFDLDLAIEVIQDDSSNLDRVVDLLASLVDRSFVMTGDSDPIRYRLLESTRDYAARRLAASEEASIIQRRHARAVAGRVNRLYRESWEVSEEGLLLTFAAELDCFRTALEWSIVNDPEIAVELMGASVHFLTMIGLLHEVSRLCARIDPLVRESVDRSTVARYLLWRAISIGGIDNVSRYRLATKSAAIYRAAQDSEGLCLCLAALLGSGQVSRGEAGRLLEEIDSMPWRNWSTKLQSFVESALAVHCYHQGLYFKAAQGCERAVILASRSGMPAYTAVNTAFAAMAHFALGDFDQPLARCLHVVEREQQRRYGVPSLPLGFAGFGQTMSGRVADARASFESFFKIGRVSTLLHFNIFAEAFVLLALIEGRHKAAACLLGYVNQHTVLLGLSIFGPDWLKEARSVLVDALGAATVRRLVAVGSRLSREDVCGLTLSTSDTVDNLTKTKRRDAMRRHV